MSEKTLGASQEPAFGLYREDRVALVIDGPNLYGTLKSLGRDADFKALHAYFSGNCRLKSAFYYVSLPDSEEYSPLRKVVDWLGYNGYNAVTKPIRQHVDDEGRRRIRRSMATDMTADMIDLAHTGGYDRMVVFSGDSELRPMVASVQRRGIGVTLVTSLNAAGDDVRWQADRFVEIENVLNILSRPSTRPPLGGGSSL